MSSPDFGKAAADYARYRQGFPDRFYGWMEGAGATGADALDLGTGTGLMARALVQRMGARRVTALDPSADLLAAAKAAADAEDLPIDHVQARAEETGLPDASYDVITAATCWHWFDRPRAAAEAHRLLRPGGKLVIAHLDWLTRNGNVIDVTRQAIQAVSPPRRDRPISFEYPDWIYDLIDAGFGDYLVTAFPAMLTYTHEAWAGRIVASAHIGPVLPPDDVDAFRRDFEATLTEHFPGPDMQVEHRVFAICLTRP